MFDIIGKRRWYFLFSALITIPGLIFILLTVFTNGHAGLQFTIDYTGGTKWELAFEKEKVVLANHRVGQVGVCAQRQGYVLGGGQVGQQAVALQQHADALA